MKKLVCLLLCLLCLTGCSMLNGNPLVGKWVIDSYVIDKEIIAPEDVNASLEAYNDCWIEFDKEGKVTLRYPNGNSYYDFEGEYTYEEPKVEMNIEGQTEKLTLKENMLIFEMSGSVVARLVKDKK